MTIPIRMLTTAETAKLLRCSERHVFKLLATGQLKKVKHGRRYTRVRETELLRFLERNER
jgi:excisionase family DNA binding protein